MKRGIKKGDGDGAGGSNMLKNVQKLYILCMFLYGFSYFYF